MAIEKDESQQTTSNINVVDADGTKRLAVSVTCAIRPQRGVTIGLDITDADAITDANTQAIKDMVAAYLAAEIEKAGQLGIPIALPSGTA